MPSSDSEGSAPSEYGYDGTDEESIGVDDRELRDMPFEALLKARKGLGEGDTPAPKATAPKQRRDQKKSAAPSSREHRSHHAPAEMSSRKPVTRRRQVVELPHVERRDPRFSTVVGGSEHNAERARRNYAFVREYQQSELDSLAKAIKSARSADVRAELERERTALKSRRDAALERERRETLVSEHKSQQRKLAKETGKQPYYLKKSEARRLYEEQRFQELAKTKNMDKVLERRRRKRAQKEKKRMPAPRPAAG